MSSWTHSRAGALLLTVVIFAAPATAQSDDDIARVADAAVNEALAAAEAEVLAQSRFDRQVEVCRIAITEPDWPSYVRRQIAIEPSIGPLAEHVRVCHAYLHGRIDALREERQRLEGPR